MKNIVEYYYMWKTTDRYVQQKRLKAVEAESKLKQVYIPTYTKPNAALLNNTAITATTKGGLSILNGSSNGNSNNDVIAYNGGKPCESCSTVQSAQVGMNMRFFSLSFVGLISISVCFVSSGMDGDHHI